MLDAENQAEFDPTMTVRALGDLERQGLPESYQQAPLQGTLTTCMSESNIDLSVHTSSHNYHVSTSVEKCHVSTVNNSSSIYDFMQIMQEVRN